MSFGNLLGTFLPTKSHLLRICAINSFLIIGEDVKFCEIFFDGPLHIPCLGCEVETDMSGQSNHCLRVCNVKMKKMTRAETPYISANIFWMGHCSLMFGLAG